MLRITPRSSAEASKQYYTTDLRQQEYYSEGHPHKHPGIWEGLAAERLGLKGVITPEAFAALCDNTHPANGKRLTLRQKSNRTVGYDFNFNPPKSVSIVHALTGDERIVAAFHAAVREAMREIERQAQTRVRIGGQDVNRPTGELAWAHFTHYTSRPVDGVPDPHLHAHCFVFNATFDAVEQRWKAAQFRDIHANAPYYQALFHHHLARGLAAIGYRVISRGHSFEIEGVTPELIEKFSRRTTKITKAAKDLGIDDDRRKSQLGATTREEKRNDLSRESLVSAWMTRLNPEERSLVEDWKGRRTPVVLPSSPEMVDRAIEYAIRWHFERDSVVRETHFLQTAIMHTAGSVEPAQIIERLRSHPELIGMHRRGQRMLTSKAVLAEEQHVVDWVKRGHKAYAPLAPNYKPSREDLAPDLAQAATHVLNSTDRVTGIAGRAGVGKTTLMREVIPAIERAGHKVLVLAPTAETGRGILRNEGFANADTVHKLLWSPIDREHARGAVWWIDEAGLMSMRDMHALVSLAEELGARLVFSGDTGQHHAVQRGDALRILREYGALSLATISKVRRQKGEYRAAVERLAEGDIDGAFAKLDAMSAIRELGTHEMHEFLAAEYLKAINAGETALIVSPTHAEGRAVTEIVRCKLLESGGIHDVRSLDALHKIDLRDAERENPASYRVGWVLDVVRAFKGFNSGHQYEICSVDSDGVYVRHPRGGVRFVDVRANAKRFGVYERGTIDLGVGDRIRITRNGKAATGSPINNGNLHTIRGFTSEGDLLLDNMRVLSHRYRFLAHGIVTTSHASQGKTVDRVFIAQSATSFPASSMEQFYVSASRGRKSVLVVTDDKHELLQAIKHSASRVAALDLLTEQPPQPAGEALGRRDKPQLTARQTEVLQRVMLPVPARPEPEQLLLPNL